MLNLVIIKNIIHPKIKMKPDFFNESVRSSDISSQKSKYYQCDIRMNTEEFNRFKFRNFDILTGDHLDIFRNKVPEIMNTIYSSC